MMEQTRPEADKYKQDQGQKLLPWTPPNTDRYTLQNGLKWRRITGPANRNGIKRTTVFALDFSSCFSKTYSWSGPENTTPSTAILCSTIYEWCSKQCWRAAKVAKTTWANFFCSSFVKSEPTELHPEELKFEAKNALLWYKYWQNNQMQCAKIQAQTDTMQRVKIQAQTEISAQFLYFQASQHSVWSPFNLLAITVQSCAASDVSLLLLAGLHSRLDDSLHLSPCQYLQFQKCSACLFPWRLQYPWNAIKLDIYLPSAWEAKTSERCMFVRLVFTRLCFFCSKREKKNPSSGFLDLLL